MEKLFFGIIIVIACTFCGYLFSAKYRRRKQFFAQFFEFNERFINEISYYRRPLKECISHYAYKGEFSQLLDTFFWVIENKETIALFEDKSEFSFLKQDEQRSIEDYFRMLGKGDSASQKIYFGARKEELQKWQSEAVITCKKYANLYIKLGFLFGLFLLILFI